MSKKHNITTTDIKQQKKQQHISNTQPTPTTDT